MRSVGTERIWSRDSPFRLAASSGLSWRMMSERPVFRLAIRVAVSGTTWNVTVLNGGRPRQ